MLVLNPGQAVFAGVVWAGVTSLVVERRAAREVVEFGDLGPHAAFVDVPEQRVRLVVTQEIGGDALDGPRPGDEGEISVVTAPAAGDAGRRRVRATGVVTGVRYEIAGGRAAVRVIELVAVSADGAADPVVVEAV